MGRCLPPSRWAQPPCSRDLFAQDFFAQHIRQDTEELADAGNTFRNHSWCLLLPGFLHHGAEDVADGAGPAGAAGCRDFEGTGRRSGCRSWFIWRRDRRRRQGCRSRRRQVPPAERIAENRSLVTPFGAPVAPVLLFQRLVNLRSLVMPRPDSSRPKRQCLI